MRRFWFAVNRLFILSEIFCLEVMSDPTSSSRINEIQRIFKEIKGLNAQISELRKSVQEGGSKDSDTDDSDIQRFVYLIGCVLNAII